MWESTSKRGAFLFYYLWLVSKLNLEKQYEIAQTLVGDLNRDLVHHSYILFIKKKDVELIKREYKNILTEYIGKGKHYIQEDHPHEIGHAISNWITTLK